jgi:hypothetical protein
MKKEHLIFKKGDPVKLKDYFVEKHPCDLTFLRGVPGKIIDPIFHRGRYDGCYEIDWGMTVPGTCRVFHQDKLEKIQV